MRRSSGHYRVVRKGDWKLQLSERPQKAWLFDLGNDPTEQTNLADSNPEVLRELTALLDAHTAASRPPLYAHQAEFPVAVDKTRAERVEEGDEIIFWPN